VDNSEQIARRARRGGNLRFFDCSEGALEGGLEKRRSLSRSTLAQRVRRSRPLVKRDAFVLAPMGAKGGGKAACCVMPLPGPDWRATWTILRNLAPRRTHVNMAIWLISES